MAAERRLVDKKDGNVHSVLQNALRLPLCRERGIVAT